MQCRGKRIYLISQTNEYNSYFFVEQNARKVCKGGSKEKSYLHQSRRNGSRQNLRNYAGAFLHNTLFPQFREVRNNNKPNGPMYGFINKHYGDYDSMKSEFEIEFMKLEGSGWVYLATDGKIKTIPNHQVRNDILLLVDRWEHAWILDYGSDKKKYLTEQWKIINWNVINTRWAKPYKQD